MMRMPLTVLKAAAVGLLVPLAAFAQSHTIVVPGSGSNTANGTALYNAVANITSPSATNRWLVKVEPGTFDLGGQQLVLRNYVDLEGSGRGVTTVTSNAVITVHAPDVSHSDINSEVRDLTIRNYDSSTSPSPSAVLLEVNGIRLTRVDVDFDVAGNGSGVALVNTTARLSHVSIIAKGSVSNTGLVGVFISGGSPNLQDVTVTTDGAPTGNHRGIVVSSAPGTVLDRVNVTVPRDLVSASGSTGVSLYDSTGVLVTNSQVTSGAGTTSPITTYGFYVEDESTAEVRNTVINTVNAWWAPALLITNGSSSSVPVVNLQGSRLRGQGGTGIGAQSYGTGTMNISQSIVEGTSYPYLITVNSSGYGTINLGASQLIGTRSYPYGGPFAKCVGAYDGTFNPIANGSC